MQSSSPLSCAKEAVTGPRKAVVAAEAVVVCVVCLYVCCVCVNQSLNSHCLSVSVSVFLLGLRQICWSGRYLFSYSQPKFNKLVHRI